MRSRIPFSGISSVFIRRFTSGGSRSKGNATNHSSFQSVSRTSKLLPLAKDIVKAGLTSGITMSAGDALCQTILRKSSSRESTELVKPNESRTPSIKTESDPVIDFSRVCRFGLIGLTLHGPFFFFGFRAIDAFYGSSRSIATAAMKMATGQTTLFPTYLTIFYYYIATLEHKTHKDRIKKLQVGFWPSYMGGCIFWPLANMINFTLVPTQSRVLYVNAVGLIWNTLLSYYDSNTSAKIKESA